MHNRRTILAIGGLLAVVAAAAPGGPLDPPAGPVAPTGKTLTEIEPRTAIGPVTTPGDADSLYRITLPGNYYLTASITGQSGRHGIEIVSSNVTIDLSGFEVIGVPGSFDGIVPTAANLRNITVLNGTVRNWGLDGLALIGTASGIVASRAIDIRCLDNGFSGIVVGDGSQIIRCISARNGQLSTSDTAIAAGRGSLISACTAHDNFGDAIFASGSTIENCTAYSNVQGISGGNCSIVGCSSFENTGSGFVGDGSTFTSCSARGNSVYGFNATSGCVVSQCTAASNSSGGIGLGLGCTLTDSSIRSNANRGVYITGSDNRISGCTITAQTGTGNVAIFLESAAARNTIVQNSLSNNANNIVGAGAALSNNVIGPAATGLGTVTTTSPWANFIN
ncbi:MAG: hypothetical protein IT438_13680 [Phycisphaerales bacterium]|nr:hypothetical protein [Phycisphaerales bacterium]